MGEVFDLRDLVFAEADFLADRAAGGDGVDAVYGELAFAQDREDFATDIAGRTDDCNGVGQAVFTLIIRNGLVELGEHGVAHAGAGHQRRAFGHDVAGAGACAKHAVDGGFEQVSILAPVERVAQRHGE